MLQVFDERNRDLIVNVGGKLTHRDRAAVSPFDSVVQGGNAVLGRASALSGEDLPAGRAPGPAARLGPGPRVRPDPGRRGDHRADQPHARRERYARQRAHQAHPYPRDQGHLGDGSPAQPAGPTLIVLAEFKEPVYDAAGIALITASVRRPAPDCLDPKIHHNNLLPSILAKIEANVAGADDAVMLDHRGFIAETNATHIFMVTGGTLATPTTVSCPEGITRAVVLELAASAGITCARRLHAAAALHGRGGLRNRHHGRPGPGGVRGRPPHRRRHPRPRHQAPNRPVRRPHRHLRHPRHLTPAAPRLPAARRRVRRRRRAPPAGVKARFQHTGAC